MTFPLRDFLRLIIFLVALSSLASCGGGVHEFVENQDQPPVAPSGSAAEPSVPPSEHRVFLTTNRGGYFDGNLGGVVGADSQCQAAAKNSGLSGTYKAIISDSHHHAKDRLVVTGNVYLYRSATNRKLIARAGEFWTRDYMYFINVSENFEVVNDRFVWTGTGPGGFAKGGNCKDWTSDQPTPSDPYSQLGDGGISSRRDWPGTELENFVYSQSMVYEAYSNIPCSSQIGALYCISQ